MEISKYVRIVSFLVTIFMACGVVQADSNNLILAQLTDNDTDDIKPQVSGPYAVWQGEDPNQGDWEIYFYDGSDVMRLTDNNSDDVNPQIDGPTAAWEGWDPNGNDWEIFYFDGISVQQLTNNDQNDTSPQLSDALIIWQCWDGNDWETFLYMGIGHLSTPWHTLFHPDDFFGKINCVEGGLISFNSGMQLINVS